MQRRYSFFTNTLEILFFLYLLDCVCIFSFKTTTGIFLIFVFQVIFGKSSCPEFCKEAYTSVCYHNR